MTRVLMGFSVMVTDVECVVGYCVPLLADNPEKVIDVKAPFAWDYVFECFPGVPART